MDDLVLPGKKYLMLLRTIIPDAEKKKRGYPENFNFKVVYSHLVWLAQWKTPTNLADIVQFLGLDDEAVASTLVRLQGHGLVKAIDGRWLALEPSGETRYWFAWSTNVKRDKPWYSRLKFFIVYLPNKGSISFRESALYFLLRSMAYVAGDVLTGQSDSGLALMLSVSRPTMKEGLETLVKHKLIQTHRSNDGKDYAVEILQFPEGCISWFRSAKEPKNAYDFSRYPGLRDKVACKVQSQDSADIDLGKQVENVTILQVNELKIKEADDANRDPGRESNQEPLQGTGDYLPGPETRRVFQDFTGYAIEDQWKDELCRTIGQNNFMPSFDEFSRMIFRASNQEHLLRLVQEHYFRTKADWNKQIPIVK